jgi:hypothetical protein
MTYKGPWNSGNGYSANDAVTFGNPATTYIALIANSLQSPDQYPGVWAVLAQAGSVGPSGPTGSAATVTFGPVNTGAAGSPASMTNTGTTTAAVLNFTIPQGAPGPAGSCLGGGSGGISSGALYHVEPSGTPGTSLGYYSVSSTLAHTTESEDLLTWVPNACTVTGLSVYSQFTAQTTLTLRSFAAPGGAPTTLLTCTVGAGHSATTCSIPNVTQINAGSFVDLGIVNQNSLPSSSIWIALMCN